MINGDIDNTFELISHRAGNMAKLVRSEKVVFLLYLISREASAH